ncbi:MAG: phage tail protein [Gammaproteobacteria bacterium]|nr:MAG: phage tail protein [Gammaproteobacteria bacterium]
MPVTKDEIKASYPIPVYNYRVEIGSDAVAFSEVSGLNIAYETYTYKESPVESGSAGPRVFNMPSQAQATTITLKKGVVPNVSVTTLYDWIRGIQTNQIEKKDIRISLCNESGEPLITWSVNNAFPTKLEAPSFTADSNDAAIESMELTADSITISEG